MKTYTTMPGDSPSGLPKVSIEQIQQLIAGELSVRARLGYTLLLLVALTAAGVTGGLWLTEPVLPVRTHVGFALLVGINLSWVVFTIWVLTARRVLLANHRIIAARMAVAFSGLTFVSALGLATWGLSGRAASISAWVSGLMLAVALSLLVLAQRHFAQLLDRRRVLETEIARDRTKSS